MYLYLYTYDSLLSNKEICDRSGTNVIDLKIKLVIKIFYCGLLIVLGLEQFEENIESVKK